MKRFLPRGLWLAFAWLLFAIKVLIDKHPTNNGAAVRQQTCSHTQAMDRRSIFDGLGIV